MLNRRLFVTAHLVLATFFLPFLLIMPLTGALYIWGYSGDAVKTDAFVITDALPENCDDHPAFFRAQFAKQNLDFTFEKIKGNGKEFTFRPSTRVHYAAAVTPEGIKVQKIEPTLLKRLIEVHKGHGPQYLRWLESAFGICLLLVAISGIWLAATSRAYRMPLVISAALGTALIVAALF